jgi:hypothetical protein
MTEDSDLSTKRWLNMFENKAYEEGHGVTRGEERTIDMLTDGDLPLITCDIVGDVTDRKKRSKKVGADSPSLESACSYEEPVRSQ